MAAPQDHSILPTETLTFKKINDLSIDLDVYLPPSSNKPAPILLWFHGGGLLQGNRNSLAPWMRKRSQSTSGKPLCVISADYRLAPQATVAEINSDVQDCIKYIRSKDFLSSLPAGSVDPTHLAVSGSSAGGYLTLLAGLHAEPKPNVILPIYPITDPLGSFFTNPQPVPMQRKLESREALAQSIDPKGPQVANCGKLGEDVRMHMYVRMLVDANLAELWSAGKAGETAAEQWRLSRKVFEKRLPPMYMLHGDADTCVGVEQGDEVVGAALGVGGAEVVYERVHGADHFLDAGESYENEKFWAFLDKHI